MFPQWHRRATWLLAGLLLALSGAVTLVRLDIAHRREAFQADARIAHRLLSQRAAQHDAILATLALLDGATSARTDDDPTLRLRQFYPQLIAVQRRGPGERWSDPALADAEARSAALPAAGRHAVLGPVDAATGRFTLVLAGPVAGHALQIDARRMAEMDGWPLVPHAAVSAVLAWGRYEIRLHAEPGPAARPAGLTPGFTFAKVLASSSQPFELRLQRPTGPAQWPWGLLAAWALGSAAAAAAAAVVWRARRERQRSTELLRLSQVARLDALGELAAGMAHELNQPLTAVLAGTQTARRLLGSGDAAPPEQEDLAIAREALGLAAAQARRAADVLARLRRLVEQPHTGQPPQAVALDRLCRSLLTLLEPELQRRGIEAQLHGDAPVVRADPVALEQIVHNLLLNAMQALDEAPAGTRGRIALRLEADGSSVRLSVQDNGPGIAPEALPRLFEPFFTTRHGGLGLGLALCESLAQTMGGTLAARNMPPHGAAFTLSLPALRP